MKDVVFAKGVNIKEGKFHNGSSHLKVGIKVAEFAKFVKDNVKGEWLNLEIKTSKSGKIYAALDTFTPKNQDKDDLPF